LPRPGPGAARPDVTRSAASAAPGVRSVTGDGANVAEIAQLARGAFAVISAIGPRHDGSDSLDMPCKSAVPRGGCAGAGRLIVVRRGRQLGWMRPPAAAAWGRAYESVPRGAVIMDRIFDVNEDS